MFFIFLKYAQDVQKQDPVKFLDNYCTKKRYKKPIYETVRLDNSLFLSQLKIEDENSEKIIVSKQLHKERNCSIFYAALNAINELELVKNNKKFRNFGKKLKFKIYL